jgi:hypothetical protein
MFDKRRQAENAGTAQFLRERYDALMSMDRDKILAFRAKWNRQRPTGPIEGITEVDFWAGTHKARTAIINFPMEERIRSHHWLTVRGYSSFASADMLPIYLKWIEENAEEASSLLPNEEERALLERMKRGETA